MLSVQEQKPQAEKNKQETKNNRAKTITRSKKKGKDNSAGEEKGKSSVSKIEKIPLPKKQIAIIIDDIGHDLETVNALLKINADITFSILPFLTHSREAAEIIRRSKQESSAASADGACFISCG